ncbi:hypothetical protein ACFPZ0_11885 [Streptomonospora nanhaiensis]|uniref:Uncharacterized protein n=1 Tax=Streptomonospora nanhaiensis TaxID=1323731 RepID=A0A853BJW0_9ACTN|nr:hypothetical protein [Streptomonospora nanhaiensis]MBV2362954.1 hypothetical protein [Streptomonospora nanhaiensis]MBX9388959.1 hypothetical protein [Streptomonospora nanhaiensis]NYI95320.1 hypothetical protein [Streptomonospora nanhaiensis]
MNLDPGVRDLLSAVVESLSVEPPHRVEDIAAYRRELAARAIRTRAVLLVLPALGPEPPGIVAATTEALRGTARQRR